MKRITMLLCMFTLVLINCYEASYQVTNRLFKSYCLYDTETWNKKMLCASASVKMNWRNIGDILY